jgi:hypothetical protein
MFYTACCERLPEHCICESDEPHCYECGEALPDGEGAVKRGHLYCRPCIADFDTDPLPGRQP